MATAAERLKASLAKYSVKKEPVNEPVRNERAELLDDGHVSGATELPQSNSESATTAQTPTVAVQHEFVSGVVLSDQLQSTDVVVVERSLEQPDSDSGGILSTGRDTDLDTSNPVHQNFLQRLSDLEAALLARDPLMKTHLGEVHKHMIQYEEIANLLRPEEIAKIMAAQQQHTGIVLRAETLGKSKAATNKKAAKIGVNDV